MSGTQRVGPYRLLRVIGEGGMGVVHLGLDPNDRAVAVKVVRPHVAADPQTRARLAREVRSLTKVRHPRVAEVLDADFDADLPYVVMRYVPGEALDAVVRRDGPMAGADLHEMCTGLFEAVSAIHSVGVVHRDLKPGNVLVLDGSPVVIDFGIARALDDVALTSTGLMVGTPGYLSPEVLDGTDVGTAADWWGWGAVVAFAATGRPPFRSGPMEAVWDRVRRGAVDLDGLDPDLTRLLTATLRPDPSTRPSPADLADAIAGLTGRRPQPAAAPGGVGAVAGSGAVIAEQVVAGTRVTPRPAPARAPRPAVDARPDPTRQAPRPDPTRQAPRPDPTRQAPRPDPTRQAPRPLQREPAPTTRVIERPPPPAPVRPAAGTAVQQPVRTDPRPPQVGAPASADRYPGAGSSVPVAGSALAQVPSGPGPADGRAVQPHARYGEPPVAPLPRRHGLALLALVVVVAVAAVTPLGAAVVGLLWASVARAVQWSRVAAAKTRWRAGRLGAGARTGLTLMYPLRLVGALLASAGYLIVGALVVSPLLLMAAAAVVVVRDVPWDDWTLVRAVLLDPRVLTVLVAVGAVVAWYGPGGAAVREGSRAITEPVARSRNGRMVLAGLAGLVVVAAVLVVTAGL
ncbi:protein kinase domain-containing protein [Aquipuribacter sp. MA13-6]|uniref:serine/threonine-protein kinase n=1 Tax=unclassified Aquipuribacter TaxID=2635084 RepID=UPI003EEFD8FD